MPWMTGAEQMLPVLETTCAAFLSQVLQLALKSRHCGTCINNCSRQHVVDFAQTQRRSLNVFCWPSRAWVHEISNVAVRVLDDAEAMSRTNTVVSFEEFIEVAWPSAQDGSVNDAEHSNVSTHV